MSNRKIQRAIPFVQVWVGVVLVILALAVSFLPIIKLQTADNSEKIEAVIADLGFEGVEIPEYMDVDAIKLVKSAGVMVDFVLASIESRNGEDGEHEKTDKLKAYLETPEGEEAFVSAVTLIVIAGDIFLGDDDKDGAGLTEEESNKEDSNDSNMMSVIFDVIVVMCALLGMLGMTVILPISFAIISLKALITALIHVTKPEKAVAKVGGTLSGTFTFIFVLMILQSFLTGVSYGTGVIALLAIAAFSALMNTVISRLRRYTREELKYLNIVQGVSVLGIVGFVIFFFNFLKTNIFVNFMNGNYTAYVGRVVGFKANAELNDIEVDINNSYLIDGIAVVALIAVVMIAISYFIACVERFSCTRDGGKDFKLIGAIITAFAFVIPTYLINSKHGYNNLTSTEATGDFSFLELSGAESNALKLVLVGIIMMLVAEIALIVLKIVFCKKLSKAEKRAVISGKKATEAVAVADVTVEETPATESPVAEEAVAEESVTEEAVAEESVTEESVAEESVAEEAVAEEAAAEEAVAEESVAEEAVAEEAAAEEAVAEESVAEEAVAEESVAEEAVAEEAAAEEAVAEESAAEEAVAEEAAAEEAVAEDTAEAK